MSCHHMHAFNGAFTLEFLGSGGESIVFSGAVTAETTTSGHAAALPRDIQPPGLISHATIARTKLAADADPHRNARYLEPG